MTLFGTDGIRGRYGFFPLDDPTIRKIGVAISESIDKKINKILLAHDGRESCEDIYKNLIVGLCQNNVYKIIFLDLFPTPSLPLILSKNQNRDTIGVEITASHNPYMDNGIKIFDGSGLKISPLLQNQIELSVSNQKNINNNIPIKLSHDPTIKKTYTNSISDLLNKKNNDSYKLNIAIDCANGAMSHVINDIQFPDNISIEIFNNQPNGKNINDECGAVYPEFLSRIISENNAISTNRSFDFGISFDGDGDRTIIIDNKGKVLDGDDLLYLFSIYTQNNKKVVGTVMTNYGIRQNLINKGFEFIESDVGDKNVLNEILSRDAFLGSESSGHIIHTDIADIPIGDGFATMIKFIHLLYELDESVDEFYPVSLKVPSSLINIDTRSPDEFISKNHPIFTKVEKILQNNGRIFIRKSGTQPLVRILIENQSEEILKKAEGLIKTLL